MYPSATPATSPKRRQDGDQNTVRQLDGIDVERTFTDKASGKDTARPQLDQLLAFVRDGDTVIVHSMDRLARNLDDLRRLVRTMTDQGVRVEFVKENSIKVNPVRRSRTVMLLLLTLASLQPRLPLHYRPSTCGSSPALSMPSQFCVRPWVAWGSHEGRMRVA